MKYICIQVYIHIYMYKIVIYVPSKMAFIKIHYYSFRKLGISVDY